MTKFLVCFFLALASLQGSRADVGSTDEDISDGPCTFPSSIAMNTNVLKLYSPTNNLYIPLASKALFRAEYEILKNRSASTEAEVAALQTRVQPLRLNSLTLLADLGITFFGGSADYYAYRCLPSNLLSPISLLNPLAPLLNVTCTVPGGSSGVASSANAGTIYFSVVWSDNTAYNVWGCIKGVQNFHILSSSPVLTSDQLATNKVVLSNLGFSEKNWQYMSYN